MSQSRSTETGKKPMLDEFDEYIRKTQDLFGRSAIPNRLVIPNENLLNLEKTLRHKIQNERKGFMIFYGPRGNGQNTAIKHFIEGNPSLKIIKVTMEATVLTNRKKIFSHIFSSLGGEVTIVSTNETDEIDALVSILEDVEKIIFLVINDFDEYTKTKRQHALYSLLETIQRTKRAHLFVFGLTSDLNFTNDLEKRVRSRFSTQNFYFMGNELEHLTKVIKKRLDFDLSKKLKYNIGEALESKENQDLLKELCFAQKTMKWIMKTIQVMLLYLDQKEMQQIKTEYVPKYVNKVFRKAISDIEPNFGYELAIDVSHPELVVLACLRRVLMKEYPVMTLKDIQEEIIILKQATPLSVFNFSPKVIEKAVFNLSEAGVINIEAKNNQQCIFLAIDIGDLERVLKENYHQGRITMHIYEWSMAR